MRLALYQPDIPQNTGTIARFAACLDLALDIIEPAGFPISDRAFRRAGMDYLDHVKIRRHASFAAFDDWRRAASHRLVLATTKADCPYTDFAFAQRDILMLGRESAGVPEQVHKAADARIVVPMLTGFRSLNVALAAAMIAGEAMRQNGEFPGQYMAQFGAPTSPRLAEEGAPRRTREKEKAR
jgi:tRNA (cytidine/uridine-2'-O-)-methyltransferase